jgi:hypothetical protein
MFDELEKIQNVEVSPHLYSKIQTRIDKNKKELISGRHLITVLGSFALILLLNILAIGFQFKKEQSSSIYNSIHPENSLYDENK